MYLSGWGKKYMHEHPNLKPVSMTGNLNIQKCVEINLNID